MADLSQTCEQLTNLVQQVQQTLNAEGTEPPPIPERDTNGRFRKGNGGGPGNPFARRVGQLRKAMLETVSADDLIDIIHAMIDRAAAGNVQAAKLVLGYTLGKPGDTVDPDQVESDEPDKVAAMEESVPAAAPSIPDAPGAPVQVAEDDEKMTSEFEERDLNDDDDFGDNDGAGSRADASVPGRSSNGNFADPGEEEFEPQRHRDHRGSAHTG